ncbi:MAG TPA: penicillin-binding protein 2 [Cyclobacteriaceae bacterium]|nr:penicillin-binding protein 2 [Cyclobacteriaceae bacterium]
MNEGRREILQVVFVLIGIIFLLKLFFIQVVDSKYKDLANSNAILPQVEYPSRGLIYDRNNKLIAYNTPEFDVEVILQDVKKFDTARFCDVFKMGKEEVKKAFKDMKARKEYSRFKPTVFIDQLAASEYARLSDFMDEFPGFYIVARTSRAYSTGSLANALGYVSEISKDRLDHDTTERVYKQGDYIGQSGIEAYYEKMLRGKRGMRYKLRNVKGVEKGSWNSGAYDTLSVPGTDLITGIDLELQQYAEFLLNGKAGSIVAIEPSSGEILTLVSGPSYDPNLLTGRKYSNNFKLISTDTMKPLFNRPLMAQYRPGSIFKIAQAMTALQMGVVTPETRIPCDRSIIDCHGPHSNEDLRGAIANSCNPYFYNVLRRMVNKGETNDPFSDTRVGLADWNKYMWSFGFGHKLGIDLPNEKGGSVPTPEDYDRWYGGRPWKFSNIYSISIGEGENLVVPLQMANFAATVANRGYYITPHIVKAIGRDGKTPSQYTEKHYTKIDSKNFDIAIDAMEAVVDHGTATRARMPDMIVCGKTGSVQNEPRPDHSVFIAFAPRDNPKIAISVYVEYSGQGARAAASIASLLMEKYINGEVKRPYLEQYVLAGHFIY